ncbi:MAG: PAN/Apple domain-containing protein [Thermodesulfobacteriota bacterium]|nr:PAN/Apple domain-containing protein [Thermodesulfobacteriota bacterium]
MLFRTGLVILISIVASSAMANQASGMQIDKKTQRSGSDYTSFYSKNANHCARECANDSRCQAFDYNRNDRTCWLKDRIPPARHNRDIVSGVKERYNSGHDNNIDGFRLDRGMARSGHDYARFATKNVRQCARSCTNDFRCRAFDFNINNRICYLKDRVPALHRNRDVVSGAKHDDGYGGGNGNYGGRGDAWSAIPAWAIGHFQGSNERSGIAISMIIHSDGEVTARWKGKNRRGYCDGKNMHLDGQDFIIKQRGDGFETILRSDRGNRAYFHRQRY